MKLGCCIRCPIIHNGTADPFDDVTGTYITTDSYTSTAIAVSDIDNGQHDPFNSVSAQEIGTMTL
ncbi:MAG: hypothetical protein HQK75_11720 [Candidatus Magnetomorum sp.]|nr:hypothetical protein [Candidatus Magnetomorum sp.]